MTIRSSDFTVDYTQSPRIITLLSPYTEVTIQDLYDTMKWFEEQVFGIDEPPLIAAAGKENLGGGVSVGLTATLLNALLAFEARPGPSYVQCSVSGGNLVAVDDVGAYQTTPIYPTAFTQVIVTASSSATTQNQASLEYSSFRNGVTVDQSGPYQLSGGDPLNSLIGNPQYPVNNIPDANLIRTARGLPKTMYVLGNLTLDSGDILENWKLYGENPARTTITINAAADTLGVEIRESSVTGNLDGGSILRECVISNLNYVNGWVYETMLAPGTITLGGTNPAYFFNCYSGDTGGASPVIDMNGTGAVDIALVMNNFWGDIKVIDKTGSAKAYFHMGAGGLTIDSSCVAGTIETHGIGVVNDALGNHMDSGIYNGNLVLVNGLVNGEHLHEMWARLGLNKDLPAKNFTDGSFTFGGVTVDATADGSGNITHQRQ